MPAKKTTKKIEPEEKPRLIVPEGCYSLILSKDELVSAIQTLGFSKELFTQMALNCRKDGDEQSAKVYSARSELSWLLYRKFKVVAGIGEPTSSEVH